MIVWCDTETTALDARATLAPSRTNARDVVLPHPSGLNRMWSEPGAFERARRLLHEAGVLPVPAHVPSPREEIPRTATTTERPALCSNCGVLVEGEHCPDCGPMVR